MNKYAFIVPCALFLVLCLCCCRGSGKDASQNAVDPISFSVVEETGSSRTITPEYFEMSALPDTSKIPCEFRDGVARTIARFQQCEDKILDLSSVIAVDNPNFSFRGDSAVSFYNGGKSSSFVMTAVDIHDYFTGNFAGCYSLSDVLSAEKKGDRTAWLILESITYVHAQKAQDYSYFTVLGFDPKTNNVAIAYHTGDNTDNGFLAILSANIFLEAVPFAGNLLEHYVRRVSDGNISLRHLYDDSLALDYLAYLFNANFKSND